MITSRVHLDVCIVSYNSQSYTVLQTIYTYSLVNILKVESKGDLFSCREFPLQHGGDNILQYAFSKNVDGYDVACESVIQ